MASNHTGNKSSSESSRQEAQAGRAQRENISDRYAWKDADSNHAKIGDIVLVLTKDDPKFPVKEVGRL